MTEALLIAVAPTGARRTKAEHAALPVTAAEIADCAARCKAAGAALLHLHVRDRDGAHLLDADAYRDATAAVRRAVGDGLIVQITTESAGRYRPEQQMAVARAVRPEAVSLAVREIIPDAAAESEAAAFLSDLAGDGALLQYILYDMADLARLLDLRRRGVVPGETLSVLFVLGRYAAGQRSEPRDLLPFLAAWEAGGGPGPWSVCAFGRRESACVLAAATLGGHVRVGFENNLWLSDGSLAADNAALVARVAAGAMLIGRPLADADQARALMAAGTAANI